MRAICIQPNCHRVRSTRNGNCGAHERRRVRGQPMDTPIRVYHPGVRQCGVVGCSRKHSARGRCKLHYGRMIERERGGLGYRAWKKLNEEQVLS